MVNDDLYKVNFGEFSWVFAFSDGLERGFIADIQVQSVCKDLYMWEVEGLINFIF